MVQLANRTESVYDRVVLAVFLDLGHRHEGRVTIRQRDESHAVGSDWPLGRFSRVRITLGSIQGSLSVVDSRIGRGRVSKERDESEDGR